jgi:nucleotide-binding universal stress UspA family protein
VGVWEAAISEQVLLSHQTEIQDAILKKTTPIFEGAGVPFEAIREWGAPAEKIITIAEHNNADLIIMGSRGLGGFASLLLGSVSDRVLHHATCPVLIVR